MALSPTPSNVPVPGPTVNAHLLHQHAVPRTFYIDAFDVLPTPALLVARGGVVACNRALLRLTRLSAHEIIGRPWPMMVQPLDDTWLSAGREDRRRYSIDRDTEPDQGHDRRLYVLRDARVEEPVRARVVPVRPNVTLVLLEATDHDVPSSGRATDRRALHELAHELRSPLHALAVSVASLNEEGDTGLQARLLASVRSTAAHLQMLVENILDAGCVHGDAVHVSPQSIDLESVIRDTVLVMDPLARAGGNRLDVDVPNTLPAVLGDTQRLRQVLVNLVHNALKYGPEGAPVTVRVRVAAHVTVEVIDRGAGIPFAEQDRVFEPYFRGGDAQRARPGHGLGLAVVKAIVAAHGSDIRVSSSAADGTRFWFALHRA